MITEALTGREDRNDDARPKAHGVQHHFGMFSARYLWPLKPFVELSRHVSPLHFLDGNIVLEPCAQGGAYLVAITGHAMAIIHDVDAKASGPMTIDFPDAAFEAARPPKAPMMDYCGECYQPDMPEWMMPGTVYAHSAGMHISPRMRNPIWAEENDFFQPGLYSRTASVGTHTTGLDFRLKEGRPLDWRGFLRQTLDMPASTKADWHFFPQTPDLFTPLVNMFHQQEDPPKAILTHSPRQHPSGNDPVIIRLSGHPEFVGVWIGSKTIDAAPVPAHFFEEESEQ
ncbi:MAG: hypothetical protein DI537_42695 [Stutzerimonas stutzeri]|nr:MAG: hypothetical protein DI537_42695 [Stutzerimonas stutzeri]